MQPRAPAPSPGGLPPAGLSLPWAWLATTIWVLIPLFTVVFLTDRPLLLAPVRAGSASRAAFVIRDLVPPFQQWGSRSFTVPNLEAAYGEVDYVTITGPSAAQSEDIVRRLVRLLQGHEVVDLFVLAHSNFVVDWVATVEPGLRARLRLVYNTGCFDLRQRQQWIDIGARSYVAHVGLSESPIFYVYFLRRWLRGGSLGEVVAISNTLAAAALGRLSSSLQWNPQATVASTHAEVTGDAMIRIDGGRP